MRLKKIRKRISRINELGVKFSELIKQFESTYSADENGNYPYHEEFKREFIPLEKALNAISSSFIRETLRRYVGASYRGVYPAAGEDIDFVDHLGGKWTLIDRAYNHQIKSFLIGNKEFKTRTSDFMTKGINNRTKGPPFDVALIRHPFGYNPYLNEYTGYEEPIGGFATDPDYWNGLLSCSIGSLKNGGILITEMNLGDMKDYFITESKRHIDETIRDMFENAGKTISGYLKRLDPIKNPLGTGTSKIPFIEYRQRLGNTIPLGVLYGFYMKR